jgi:hypothetical protein
MILRFDNVIYDLKYAEKIALFSKLLLIRFANGKEEVVNLNEYDCDSEELMKKICEHKNNDVILSFQKCATC